MNLSAPVRFMHDIFVYYLRQYALWPKYVNFEYKSVWINVTFFRINALRSTHRWRITCRLFDFNIFYSKWGHCKPYLTFLFLFYEIWMSALKFAKSIKSQAENAASPCCNEIRKRWGETYLTHISNIGWHRTR